MKSNGDNRLNVVLQEYITLNAYSTRPTGASCHNTIHFSLMLCTSLLLFLLLITLQSKVSNSYYIVRNLY
jgi:hypothetical protein